MKVKKKVILTLALALFAAMTLLTSTFAWFSIAQSATVGDLQLKVTESESLLISVDGVNYYEKLTPLQFGSYIKQDLALTNVTTSDLENFYNSYEGDEALENEDYLTFTLYFKSLSPHNDGLYLIDNKSNSYTYDYAIRDDINIAGTYVYSKGVEYKTPVSFQYAEDEIREAGSTDKYYAAEALRMGFKELPFDAEDTRTEFSSFIYDPSGKEYRGWGVEYGALDFVRKTVDSNVYVPTTNIPDTKYALTTFRYGRDALNNDSLCGTLQERTSVSGEVAYYSKVQVYIWLEGWDADCFDSIYTDNLLIQFHFRSAIKAI